MNTHRYITCMRMHIILCTYYKSNVIREFFTLTALLGKLPMILQFARLCVRYLGVKGWFRKTVIANNWMLGNRLVSSKCGKTCGYIHLSASNFVKITQW